MKTTALLSKPILLLSLVSSDVMACGIQPKNGRYRLELGDRVCGEKITVYLNDGGVSQTVRVKGWTTVNLHRR